MEYICPNFKTIDEIIEKESSEEITITGITLTDDTYIQVSTDYCYIHSAKFVAKDYIGSCKTILSVTTSRFGEKYVLINDDIRVEIQNIYAIEYLKNDDLSI